MTKLDNLFDQVRAFDRPPVDTWFPEKTVEFDLVIKANGDWLHEGAVISRHKLVKLFSTVLVCREGQYYLVTPPAKYRIRVEDAPFLAVEVKALRQSDQQKLVFRTNMDEVVAADEMHPLEVAVDHETGEPNPYVLVRDGLKARLTRSVFYQVADIALTQNIDENRPGVTSAGCFFPLA